MVKALRNFGLRRKTRRLRARPVRAGGIGGLRRLGRARDEGDPLIENVNKIAGAETRVAAASHAPFRPIDREGQLHFRRVLGGRNGLGTAVRPDFSGNQRVELVVPGDKPHPIPGPFFTGTERDAISLFSELFDIRRSSPNLFFQPGDFFPILPKRVPVRRRTK